MSTTRKYLRSISGLHSCLPWARKADIRGEECCILYSLALIPRLLALDLDTAPVLRAVAALNAEMVPTQKLLGLKQWTVRGVKGATRSTLKAQKRALALLDTVRTDASQRIDAARRLSCPAASPVHSEP
eukprot:m51a1_g6833 hypothetical protein (129) ;mRNA; r:53547-54066